MGGVVAVLLAAAVFVDVNRKEHNEQVTKVEKVDTDVITLQYLVRF